MLHISMRCQGLDIAAETVVDQFKSHSTAAGFNFSKLNIWIKFGSNHSLCLSARNVIQDILYLPLRVFYFGPCVLKQGVKYSYY